MLIARKRSAVGIWWHGNGMYSGGMVMVCTAVAWYRYGNAGHVYCVMSQPTPLYQSVPSANGTTVAVVAARWNAAIIDRLLDGVRSAWSEYGGDPAALELFRCPGSYELPLAVQACAQSGKYSAVIALGCVIRGDTYHFELVADAASEGIMRVMLDTGVPCIFGVLTTETVEQALDRSDTRMNNKGYEAVIGALDMIHVLRNIRPSA